MNVTNIDAPDEATTGPILVLGLLQYLFQGVILSQGVKFWTRQADDSLRLRLYVTTLVLFSILQTTLETYKDWLELIVREHWWQSPLHCTEILVNGLITSLCEVFLIRRCWKITGRNHWILGILAALATATFVTNIYLAVKIGQVIGASINYTDPLKAGHWAFPFWVYGSLVIALSLTSILSFSLWETKTGLKEVDKVVTHIIGLTWESCALPTICMILAASFYSTKKLPEAKHLDLFFILLTGKLYSVGILRTVNSRTVLRERLASSDIGGRTSLSDFKWDQPSSNTCSASQQPIAPNENPGLTSLTPEVSRHGDNMLISVATALDDGSDDLVRSHRDQRQERTSHSGSSHVSSFTLA